MKHETYKRTVSAPVTETIYQWIRKVAYDAECSEAEIVRRALALFQQKVEKRK